MSAGADREPAVCYRVVIAGNLVCAIRRLTDPGASVHPTPLDAASRLAAAFQANGAIDGEYDFDSLERARVFARLCLDFTARLVARRSEELERHPAGEEYHAGPGPAGGH